MNYNFLSNYKGVVIIILIVVAILFYSKDLDGVLLMTGIIVNVIAICLNTGATSFKGKKQDTFISPKRFDLIKKEKAQNSPQLRPQQRPRSRSPPTRPPQPQPQPEVEVEAKIAARYKGAVDYDEGGCTELYPEVGMDRAVKISLERQGVNYRRQISGATRRNKVLWPQIAAELVDEENMPWWQSYDL